MLAGMQFERKSPASKLKKAEYAALEAQVAGILKELKKLHLRLWFSISRRDYHSLSLEEAYRTLDEIRRQMDNLL